MLKKRWGLKKKKTDVWPLSHFEKGIEADKFSTLLMRNLSLNLLEVIYATTI